MHKLVKNPSNRNVLLPPIEPYPYAAGNVLIYVVVLMLIFGVLGVVMVSLFTSTTASTVTRNDSRRANYMAESGVRYASSELRKADFEENIIIDPLNTLTYTVSGEGSFNINIFSPWFDSNSESCRMILPPPMALVFGWSITTILPEQDRISQQCGIGLPAIPKTMPPT
jgi:hypothetical protein